MKKITTLNPTSSDFRPKTGWIFLPLDGTEQTRNDCLALNPRGALEDKSCSLCNGCAKLLCKRCVGKGKIPTLGTVNEKRDIGFGMTASSNSLTTNMVVCNVCSGSGRVDCTGCKDGRDPNLSR